MPIIVPSKWIESSGEAALVRCFAQTAMPGSATRRRRLPIVQHCRMTIGRQACSVFLPETDGRLRRSFAAAPPPLTIDARADGLFVHQTDGALIAKTSKIDRSVPIAAGTEQISNRRNSP